MSEETLKVKSDNEEEAVAETEEEVTVTDQEELEAEQETDEAEEPAMEEQLEMARQEVERNLDGWRRAQAELANARKRFEKQRAEAYVKAAADVVAKILPVLDDYERALDNVPQDIADHSWFEGIVLVQRKLEGILDAFNVEPIEAVGQEFDPNLHEAVLQESTDEYESGVVTKELQKGYRIGEQVIRPSLVYVAE